LQYYRDKGFFDARIIERKGDYDKKKKVVNFTFRLYEGERTKIGDITIEGANELKEKDILKIIGIGTGDWFDDYKIKRGVFFLTREYSTIGHIDMKISYDIERERNLVFLKFKIDEGEKFYVNDVKFTGNKDVRDKIIEREIRIKKGDVYNLNRLFETQNRLYGTLLFSDVDYEIKKVSNDSIEIMFLLKEMKKRWFDFGLGYESPDKLNFEINWGNNNLFNNLQRLKINTRFAYKFNLTYNFNIQFSYEEPYLLGKEVQFFLKPEYRFYKDTSFTQDIRILNMSFVKFYEQTMLSLILNMRQAKVDTSGNFIDTTDYKWTNSIILNTFSEGRDNIVNPLNGFYLFCSVEKAGGLLGGYNRFIRFELENAIYKGIKNSTFCFRVKTIFTLPEMEEEMISQDARIELGGWRSIRGYDEGEIGVLDQRGKRSGLDIILINTEFRIKFLKRFYLVFFYDLGNNYLRIKEINFKDVYAGTGIGFGYLTEIGAIRIDYGRKIEKESESYKGKLYINIGHPF